MKFCNLSKADIPRMVDVEEAAYQEPWTRDVFERCFDVNYHAIGLADNDSLAGYIIYSLQVGECHILNICVHPQHQHQGHGRRLMEQALKKAKQLGAGITYLEVRRSNQYAIHLYHQLGFVQIGERKNYYPTEKGREDALVFAKDLQVE